MMKKYTLRALTFVLLLSAAVGVSSVQAQDVAVPAPANPAASGSMAPAASIPSLPTDNVPVLPGEGGAAAPAGVDSGAFGAVPKLGESEVSDNGVGLLDREYRIHMLLNPQKVKPNEVKTLFFTAWQHALLQEAKQYFNTRPPSAEELAQQQQRPEGMGARPMGPREVSLGGIAWRSSSDWTVWLNSQRITPNAIPSQVLDIRVSQGYIDLKWFDTTTNLIYPIRLRPHQRFNLDSRIFLPGSGIGEPLPAGTL